MARKIQPRVSFLADSNYLVRLARAIEIDKLRSDKWRREALEHVTALVAIFNTDALSKK